MTELIPITRVLNSVAIYDELELIKDPLYRDKRWLDVHNNSMAKHRTYMNRMLSWYSEIDEVQVWLICLLAALHKRLENSSINYISDIIKSAWPPTTDQTLQAYRENLMKLMV